MKGNKRPKEKEQQQQQCAQAQWKLCIEFIVNKSRRLLSTVLPIVIPSHLSWHYCSLMKICTIHDLYINAGVYVRMVLVAFLIPPNLLSRAAHTHTIIAVLCAYLWSSSSLFATFHTLFELCSLYIFAISSRMHRVPCIWIEMQYKETKLNRELQQSSQVKECDKVMEKEARASGAIKTDAFKKKCISMQPINWNASLAFYSPMHSAAVSNRARWLYASFVHLCR